MQVFSILKEMIGQKLVGWKGKLLSIWGGVGEGNPYKSGSSSNSHLHHELLHSSIRLM